jgi:hypothetical protein
MRKKTPDLTEEIVVPTLTRASVRLRIIGTTGHIQNRMAAKAMQTLLVGGQRKTKADRAQIKHDPPSEYRNSVEMMPRNGRRERHNGDHPGATALALRTVAVKAAMCTAALDTNGLSKTSSQRLLFMPNEFSPLYGVPQLRMDVVRSADIAKTPDIRTRAFLPRWGAEVELQFVVPQLSGRSVLALLCNAGVLVGVGDGRQEKGKLNYGCFRVIGEGQQDDEWDDLVANHGRTAQLKALQKPEYANEETAELMAFFFAETQRRAA